MTHIKKRFLDEFINDIEVNEPKVISDSIVDNVIQSFRERSNVGIKKYGVTLDREDLSPLEWISHLQQELQDAILYAEKLKGDLAEDSESKTSYHLLKVEEVNIKSNFGHSIHRNFNQVCLEYSLDGKVVTLNIT